MQFGLLIIVLLIVQLRSTSCNDCVAELFPKKFVKHSVPTRLSDCIPFKPMVAFDMPTALFVASVAFTQLICDFVPKNETDLVKRLYFNIYHGDDPVRVIPGLDFFYNPLAYIPADAKCIKFLIGGFTTACIDDAYKFPESDDWLSFSARSLSCRTDCYIVVVNWGNMSGNNYACLVRHILKPMGRVLAIIFKILNPTKIHVFGHSLGAHIAGFACKEVKDKGDLVQLLIGFDPAGPLIRNNNCLWQLGLFECGMMKGVAYKTVAFYSNPGIFGTANFDSADVNVRCNPPSYSQPGCWLGDPVYGHSFAAYLCAALCAGFQCYADQGNNLNAVDNHNITAGNYVLTTTKCFPYCLNKKG